MFSFFHSKEQLLPHGVITGISKELEWMLPWWWSHYSSHSNYPVVFLNFGMTKKAVDWCSQRGLVLDLPSYGDFVKGADEVEPILVQKWQTLVQGDLFTIRREWFKKPLGLLLTPFHKNLWIDIDCQIQGSLGFLFDSLSKEKKVLVKIEREETHDSYLHLGLRKEDEILYNSGVVGFLHNDPVIQDWAYKAYYENHLYLGDQEAFSSSLYEGKGGVVSLPPEYNCSFYDSHPNPQILHFIGSRGKKQVLETIYQSPILSFYDLKELL